VFASFNTRNVVDELLIHANSAFEEDLLLFLEFLHFPTQTTIFFLILALKLKQIVGH
jgi:hypothetical protein